MKTNTRSVPLDMLSVSERNRRIRVFRHRNEFGVIVEDGDKLIAEGYFSFDQFFDTLHNACYKHAGAPKTPYSESSPYLGDRTPPGALQQLKTEAL